MNPFKKDSIYDQNLSNRTQKSPNIEVCFAFSFTALQDYFPRFQAKPIWKVERPPDQVS